MSGDRAGAPAWSAGGSLPPWRRAPRRLALQPGHVHVWRIDLDDADWTGPAQAALLSEDERARAGRFVQDRHRRRFAAGRAALRTILGGYLDSSPASLVFAGGSLGKPALDGAAGASHLSFSMSHSGGTALTAVIRECEVGIDIEQVRPGLRLAEIAHRYFSADDARAVLAVPPSRQPAAFLRCWCAFEARLKAMGAGFDARADVIAKLGLPEPLRSTLDDGTWTGIAGPWLVSSLDAGEGFAAVVAVEASAVQASDGWLTTFRAYASDIDPEAG